MSVVQCNMQLYHYQIMVLRAEIMLVGGDGSRDNYFIATTLISSAVRRGAAANNH